MSSPRVVLVDDTEDLRQLMRIALRRAGFEIVGEAGDGAAGIEVARGASPDLVVLDLSMPVMDGLEALPHIRTSCPDATIVVMSGFGAAQMTERALARGADGYVQKGAPLAEVVAYLDRALGRHDGVVAAGPPAAPVPAAPSTPGTDASEVAELAPVAALEVADEAGFPIRYANAAARDLLGPEAVPGVPLDRVSEALGGFVSGFRVDPETSLDVTLGGTRVRATLRRAATGLLLYLDATSGEVAALRRGLAMTAHELRGPISVITGAAETLEHPEAEELDADVVTELTAAMARQARILDGLTLDLLTSAQTRHGGLRVELGELRPDDLVATLAARWDAGLDVTDRRAVRADPLRVEQILTNLLSNARTHGRPPVDVRVRAAGPCVAIDVADHGDGVPAAFRERLFQEFARADSVPVTGTGLGLHVVRTLAEAMGGSASYAPGPDGGAVFTVELPVFDEDARTDPHPVRG